MNDLQRRICGYGSTAVVAAGLIWAGFLRHESADIGTLESSIRTQLGLAFNIPAKDKDGNELTARTQMMATAEQMLGEAEQLEPERASLREFRGFLHHLRGEYKDAAQCYAEARGMQGVDAEMRDTLVFNQARMLDAAGEPKAALTVFEEHRDGLQAQLSVQCDLERAALLHQLERDAEAIALLKGVLEHRGEPPMAWVRAGEQLEELGETEAADQAFAQAGERAEGTNYFRARLKLRQGEVDRSLQLLTRAVATAPAQVRRWVKEDQSTWQELETDARYQQLFAPAQIPAQPGR